jgi:hypothetical protein
MAYLRGLPTWQCRTGEVNGIVVIIGKASQANPSNAPGVIQVSHRPAPHRAMTAVAAAPKKLAAADALCAFCLTCAMQRKLPAQGLNGRARGTLRLIRRGWHREYDPFARGLRFSKPRSDAD